MALDALRCNHLAPLGFKGLKWYAVFNTDTDIEAQRSLRSSSRWLIDWLIEDHDSDCCPVLWDVLVKIACTKTICTATATTTRHNAHVCFCSRVICYLELVIRPTSPFENRACLCDFLSYYTIKSKVVPYSITSVKHGADPGFLAVSPPPGEL